MSQTDPVTSPALTVFRFFGAATSSVQRLVESAYSSVFMGLLDEEIFDRHMTYPFGKWRGGVSVDTDQEAMASWIAPALSGRIATGSRILVIAAGGGREIRGLLSSGFQVVASEPDPELETETRKMLAGRGLDEAVEFLPFSDIEQGRCSEKFDAVLIARFYLSYRRGRENRIQLLKAARKLLSDNGTLAFDWFLRPKDGLTPGSIAFLIQPPIANFFLRLRRKRETRVELGDHLDPQVPLYHHHYVEKELQLELGEAGLSSVSTGTIWYGWSVATPAAAPKTSTPTQGGAPAAIPV